MSCKSEGKLDIMLGSMFSGKSSALLRKLSQFHEIGEKVLYINHTIDTRSNLSYSTHCKLINGVELSFDSMKVSSFENFDYTTIANYKIIGIDEAQFFDDSIISFVTKLIDEMGIYVIIVGLDGSYKREPLGYILNLIPLADNIVKLHAYCKSCFEKDKKIKTAIFSKKIISNTSDVLVGAGESYIPVCRSCFLN